MNLGQNKTNSKSGLAKGVLTCFVETWVPKQSFRLRMHFRVKIPCLPKFLKGSSNTALFQPLTISTNQYQKNEK